MNYNIYKFLFNTFSNKKLSAVLFLIFSLFKVEAQQNLGNQGICGNLSQLISSAETSALGTLKGELKGAKVHGTNAYLVSDNAKISFDKKLQRDVYEEVIAFPINRQKDSTSQGTDYEYFLAEILKCLSKSEWTAIAENNISGSYSHSIKNLKTRVFITTSERKNNLIFRIFTQPVPTAKCLSGDCVNGFGTMQYETGDIYEGQFLNSQRIGMGKYVWTDKSRYEGSWLNDSMSGFGVYFNAQGDIEKQGYLMQGNAIVIDSSKTDFCQYGDCTNGFGMYFYKGGQIYIGNFKNGLQNGFGLFESPNGIYYGSFANGKYNGTGIVFTPEGTVFKSTFINGEQTGSIKEVKQGESVKEGKMEDSMLVGAEYTPEGILMRVGKWDGDKFIPSEIKSDKYIVEFAESLAKLYSFRDAKYGRLRGNMRKGKRVVYYDAIFKLKDARATFVREELEKEPYVRANLTMSAVPKDEAIAKYEWAKRTVRKSLSKSWKSDPGKIRDTEELANRNYIFTNMENTESYIEVKIEDNIVYIDIH